MDNIEILNEFEGEWLIADGFNDAIIGTYDEKVVYSTKKCIEILCEDMSEEDALEHFDFNVSGAYVGEKTPIYVEDLMF